MTIFNHYIIYHKTILFLGEYHTFGNLYTRVVESNRTFLVTMTPLQLLDYSIKHTGSDLKGAINSARFLLGKKCMYPIIVNSQQGVCVFPTISTKRAECIYFNPKHIFGIKDNKGNTDVKLSNEHTITVEKGSLSFSNKVDRARRFLDMIKKNGEKTMEIRLEPKMEKPIIKEENGKYNFNCLNDECPQKRNNE
ncbi:competence protein ComK [Cytobacillus eiseniae]|uniref:Competence protein ComK n=1 Tax=Cytobacillus eiseniae TaxID=762947 RepID=A0ABS4RHJ2_9BACI|nr:competence protein ComK [Cytobacillus eiseniae]MBP2242362.1 competence protein ComK [Cytobacillus eiseniae]